MKPVYLEAVNKKEGECFRSIVGTLTLEENRFFFDLKKSREMKRCLFNISTSPKEYLELCKKYNLSNPEKF